MITVDRKECPACGCDTAPVLSGGGKYRNPYAAEIETTTETFNDGTAIYLIEWTCGRCGAKWQHNPKAGAA